MTSLLLTFLAHGLADFVFQSDRTMLQKEKLNGLGFLSHGSVVLLTLLILLSGYHYLNLFLYGILICLAHLLVDFLKSVLQEKFIKFRVFWFLLDQFFHALSLIIIWQRFHLEPNLIGIQFCSSLLTSDTVMVFQQTFPEISFKSNQILFCILIYVYVCWGGGYFIKKFLMRFHEPEEQPSNILTEQVRNSGFYIGVLERFIILTLVLNDALTAVAFIFTAKSIARYSELNNKAFAEYYLTGTLLSTSLAISGGFLLKELLSGIV